MICRTVVVCLLLSVASANAQVWLPNTAPGRQFAKWLDPFNAADPAQLLHFFDTVLLVRGNRTVPQELALRTQTGGFDLMKIEESLPTSVTGLLKERDGDRFARFTVDVEPAPPNRIVSFRVTLVPRPAEFSVARLTEQGLQTALATEIARRVAADQFAGTVIVAKQGIPVVREAYGFADRTQGVRNTMNTKFRLGSMNKMFTAVAVLQLVQSGRVRLNAVVGDYLSDYPNKNVASRVTIHHLLTHTGGTGDIFGADFRARRLNLKTHGDYVDLFGARDLVHEPGARWQYSNYGFVLLGAIIEKVSGQSYYDYVRDHVFKPAGMASTGSEPEEQGVPGLAVGYMKSPSVKEWVSNAETLPYRGTAAGGGYSTADDLLCFASALQASALLDARHTELLTTAKVDGGPGRYAYGFGDVMAGGVRWVGHNGGAPGMNGDLRIFTASGYVVIVLANQDPPAADRLGEFIANRLPEN